MNAQVEEGAALNLHHQAWRGGFWIAAILLCCSCTLGKEETTLSEDKHGHHEVDYIEFSVTDMAQSQRFYAAAFDWQFNDYGPEYAGIRKRQGGEVGGLRVQSEVAAGGPLVILYSDDLEGTLARVQDAGGQITQEIFDFPGGRRFHFMDPSGNELAVWSAR